MLQVGVNAPGTANSTIFLAAKTYCTVVSDGPSGVMILNLASGRRSPIEIGMLVPSIIMLRKRQQRLIMFIAMTAATARLHGGD